jgi:hypothetical protein
MGKASALDDAVRSFVVQEVESDGHDCPQTFKCTPKDQIQMQFARQDF